ncbi:phosphotransferase [Photobacterium sp. ZSDE20]|uniref:Phosphotransferase n=1 Tax=Photobacterium pectinilyticum TaxID=2906793 RepID=A0ABT1MXW7_9GAMM|nr:phosphotransferase [Photobacterium sp. ZSDE20]MCQ1057325.1 phosphotransferase [Photobacterium sp. ZSDE20]MDD1821784.1 phosphotransferase [Photobacterium sp. ZSDE20]
MPEYHLDRAKPLSGGLSNRCWQVVITHCQTGRCQTLVWRPCSASSKAFGVSRQQEHDVLQAISPYGKHDIAPRPFALLAEGLFVEWADGQTATPDLPVKTVMDLLGTIHQLPSPSWRLDCQLRGAHYWQYVGGAVEESQLCRIHAYFQSLPIKTWFADTCCHHDLGWYNVIVAPNGQHQVIDWEYAAAGDPSLDLALTIAANQLEISEAISRYCQCMGITDATEQARWLSAVTYWQPWCDYLAMLWFYVGSQYFSDQEQPDEGYLSQARLLQEKLWNDLQLSD